MVLGIGLEGLQTLVPERVDLLSDLLFDAVGALTGVGAVFLLEQLRVSRTFLSMAWAGASAVLVGLVSVAMVLWTPYIPSLADCGVLTPETSGPATPSGVRDVATARVDAAEVSPIEGRVNDGLVVFYDFSEGSGNVVRDISGVPTPLDLTILDAGKIQWLPESNGVRFTPNPPKDTDGRREDSGRGWVRELQGRWPGVGVDGRSADGLQSPHRAPKALCGSCDARDGERIRSRGLSRPGWREIAGTLSQLQAGRQAGSGMARSRARARLNCSSQGQRRGRCRVNRRAERVIRPAKAKTRRLRVLVVTVC